MTCSSYTAMLRPGRSTPTLPRPSLRGGTWKMRGPCRTSLMSKYIVHPITSRFRRPRTFNTW
eukprot:1725330-Pleurochrysis_carterae.AAC.1